MRIALRSIGRLVVAVAVVGIAVPVHAQTRSWAAIMNGTNEVPPTGSPATGYTLLTLMGNMLTVNVTYSGLTGGNPAAAHIHCCVAPGSNVGVAVGFPSFPTMLSGTYSHVFDLTSTSVYTAGFLNNFGGGTAAGAESALIAGLDAGQAYSNIHNRTFGGGEIRGILVATPEPSTYVLMATGLLAIGALARRRSHG